MPPQGLMYSDQMDSKQSSNALNGAVSTVVSTSQINSSVWGAIIEHTETGHQSRRSRPIRPFMHIPIGPEAHRNAEADEKYF